jgi:8-oxo-dGTP diphosphatase
MAEMTSRVTFGLPPTGTAYEDRRAAYAVIFDVMGRVAVVRGGDRWFLPGGGSLTEESPEATVLREVREECAQLARIVAPVGQAIQYFRDSTRWYKMTASFFRAEFLGEAGGVGEHELAWLAPGEITRFFHECHLWAVSRAREQFGDGPTTP